MNESAPSKIDLNDPQPYDDQIIIEEEDDDQACVYALQISNSFTLSITLSVALDLRFFDIISKAGRGATVSASEVASSIPTRNPRAGAVVDRMLHLLATHSLLTCELRTLDEGGHIVERVYGLSPAGKCFVSNKQTEFNCETSQSSGPFMDKWQYMKDAVLEDIIPFEKACGMSLFEFTNKNPEFNHTFNKTMAKGTSKTMKKILETYKGFEEVQVLVDVGGGLGTSLELIVSKYPRIKGINFDLPHVVSTTPHIPGVEHVAGDMFQDVPSGDAIMMKSILHDFDDEDCLKLLKNCYKALPEKGKVIVVTTMLGEAGESSAEAKFVAELDITMLSHLPGRERTEREFKALAFAAGFPNFQLFYGAHANWVIELRK